MKFTLNLPKIDWTFSSQIKMDIIPIWEKDQKEVVVIRGPWKEPELKIYVEEEDEVHSS